MYIVTYYCGVVTVDYYILFVSVSLSVGKVTVSLSWGGAHVCLSVVQVLVGGKVGWGFYGWWGSFSKASEILLEDMLYSSFRWLFSENSL